MCHVGQIQIWQMIWIWPTVMCPKPEIEIWQITWIWPMAMFHMWQIRICQSVFKFSVCSILSKVTKSLSWCFDQVSWCCRQAGVSPKHCEEAAHSSPRNGTAPGAEHHIAATQQDNCAVEKRRKLLCGETQDKESLYWGHSYLQVPRCRHIGTDHHK